MTEKPELKTASVVLKYLSKSGYRAESTFKSHADCPKPMDANRTLVAAASEIARVAAIAGAGEDLRSEVAKALEAVYEDMPELRPTEGTK